MASPRYQVYGLNETYPELGTYSFKVVLSPRYYKSGQEFEVVLVDSDRKPMRYDVKKWGRKLNVSFAIDSNTSDGVAYATLVRRGQEVGRLTWWIIKP